MLNLKLLTKTQERLVKWIELDLKKVPDLKVNTDLINAVFIYYLLISNVVQKDKCDRITNDFMKKRKTLVKFTEKYLPEVEDNYYIDSSTYIKKNYSDLKDSIFKDLWGHRFISMHH